MPPMSSCRDSVSTCWSVGELDWDCPGNNLCCFDGCANTCLDSAQNPAQPSVQSLAQPPAPNPAQPPVQSQVQAEPLRPVRGPQSASPANAGAQRPRPSNVNQVSLLTNKPPFPFTRPAACPGRGGEALRPVPQCHVVCPESQLRL